MDRARLLRRKATEPERILWRHLRNRNFAGHKFRRQHPFDDYVLDFDCPNAKLAIELNGGGHNYRTGQFATERARNFWLAMELSWRDSGIIRFAKSSIACWRAIWFALGERQKNNPSPSSSRRSARSRSQGRGGLLTDETKHP